MVPFPVHVIISAPFLPVSVTIKHVSQRALIKRISTIILRLLFRPFALNVSSATYIESFTASGMELTRCSEISWQRFHSSRKGVCTDPCLRIVYL